MKVHDIHTVAVIGSGTMGHAIAMEFAIYGLQVHLIDINDKAVAQGLDAIRQDLEQFKEHDLIGNQSQEDVFARISTFTTIAEGVTGAQYVSESVAEKLDVKQSVWREVEQAISPDAILTTNTSGLSPSTIAEVLSARERFVVAHYWNPAHLMPLVEVVPAEHTSQETVDTTVEFLRMVGKKAYPLKKECLGFVGNRIQMAVIREALNIVSSGIADASDVDEIVKYSLGRRWNVLGPIISADLGGLDIFEGVSSYLLADLDNSTKPNPLLHQKVTEGKLGNKTGSGFYEWSGDDGKRIVETRNNQLIAALESDKKIQE